MGVSGLYKWIVQRYPLVKRNLNDPSKPNFDNLFIDFNSILYCCLKTSGINNSKNIQSFVTEVKRILNLIVHLIRPTKLIYIAADGTAPTAKILRKRFDLYNSFQL